MKTIQPNDVFAFPDNYVQNEIRYIYGLIDPRAPDQIRYVGIARHPLIRLNDHFLNGRHFGSESTAEEPRGLPQWIHALIREGSLPASKVLEVTDLELAFERERFWIDHLHEQGAPLLNGDFKSRRQRGDLRDSRYQGVLGVKNKGKWLLSARQKLGWSQRRLGDVLGVHISSVSRWEHESRGIPPEVIPYIEKLLEGI